MFRLPGGVEHWNPHWLPVDSLLDARVVEVELFSIMIHERLVPSAPKIQKQPHLSWKKVV